MAKNYNVQLRRKRVLSQHPVSRHGRRLAPNRKKGGIAMVTYEGLFQFVLVLVAVVTLVLKITKK